jgi:hypothetical protein
VLFEFGDDFGEDGARDEDFWLGHGVSVMKSGFEARLASVASYLFCSR